MALTVEGPLGGPLNTPEGVETMPNEFLMANNPHGSSFGSLHGFNVAAEGPRVPRGHPEPPGEGGDHAH